MVGIRPAHLCPSRPMIEAPKPATLTFIEPLTQLIQCVNPALRYVYPARTCTNTAISWQLTSLNHPALMG